MQRTLADMFVPIFDAINLIEAATAKGSTANFDGDKFHKLAIERAFEIISAASRRVPSEVKIRQPKIDWKRLAGLHNHLRVEYYNDNSDLLLQIAVHDLPPLKALTECVLLKLN